MDDSEDLTETNSDFRRVLCTGKQLQLVRNVAATREDIEEAYIPTATGLSGRGRQRRSLDRWP